MIEWTTVDPEIPEDVAESRRKEFKILANRLIEFLNVHGHPHMKIIITTDSAELLEDVHGYVNKDFIKD